MTVETPELTKYNKRIEDLIEDAEIEAELEAESKVRSKNTRLFTISSIGIAALLVLYFGIRSKPADTPEEARVPEPAQAKNYVPNPKPIPFPVKPEESKVAGANAAIKPVEAKAEVPDVFEPPPVKNPPQLVRSGEKPKTEKPATVKTSVSKTVPAKPIAFKPKLQTAPTTSSAWFIQLGAFSVKRNAEALAKKLEGKGLNATVQSRPGAKQTFAVFVGEFKDKTSGKGMAEDLKRAGFSPKLESYGKNRFSFTVGRFGEKSRAKNFQDKLSVKGFLSGVQMSGGKPGAHVVGVGKYASQVEAKKELAKIKSLGFKGFIKKIG